MSVLVDYWSLSEKNPNPSTTLAIDVGSQIGLTCREKRGICSASLFAGRAEKSKYAVQAQSVNSAADCTKVARREHRSSEPVLYATECISETSSLAR